MKNGERIDDSGAQVNVSNSLIFCSRLSATIWSGFVMGNVLPKLIWVVIMDKFIDIVAFEAHDTFAFLTGSRSPLIQESR